MDRHPNSSATPPQPLGPRPLLVLHINDSTDDQVLLQAAAHQAGVPMEWHVAESVQRAISYLKSLINLSRKQRVRWVDLIVLDLIFHNGSGLTVLKFIRSTPEIRILPVVVLTGNINPATLQEAQSLGADAFHHKPVDFEETVKMVGDLYQNWSTLRRPKGQQD